MNKKGFTLYELLISIALLSIVLIFLLSMFTNISNTESASKDQTALTISKNLTTKIINADIFKYGGISSIVSCGESSCSFNLVNDDTVRYITIDDGVLKYKKGSTLYYSDKISVTDTSYQSISYTSSSSNPYHYYNITIGVSNNKYDVNLYSSYK